MTEIIFTYTDIGTIFKKKKKKKSKRTGSLGSGDDVVGGHRAADVADAVLGVHSDAVGKTGLEVGQGHAENKEGFTD